MVEFSTLYMYTDLEHHSASQTDRQTDDSIMPIADLTALSTIS